MRSGNLFIVSGPSGAGKGTLVREILARVPDVWLSVSATTRPPRPGEVEGREYFFVSPERFDELARTGGFLESAEVHGNRYGTPREAVERMMARGAQVVLEIDPQGAMQVKEAMPSSVLVFIKPPDMDELRRRLTGRGSETPDEVELRMRTAETEMRFAGTYDYVVENDEVERAAQELVDIIDTHAEHRADTSSGTP